MVHCRWSPARRLPALVAAILLNSLSAQALDPAKAVTEYSLTSWADAEGLATGVTSIAQDGVGYLWVGGANGLFRFDGQRFVRQPLPSAAVLALAAGRDGSLWVGLTEGNVLRLINGVQTAFPLQVDLPPAAIRALLVDRGGTMWVGTSNGVARLVDGHWRAIPPEHGLPNERIDSLYEDPDGRIWVTSEAGLFERRDDDRFVRHQGPPQTRGVSRDAGGTMWATDQQRIFAAIDQPGGFREEHSPPVKGLGMALHHDREGSLWVATRGQGLIRVRDGRVEALRRQDGLASDSLETLFEDREGNLWIGTRRGLSLISEGSVSRSAGQGPGGEELIYSVTADQDGVWIGTIAGLDRFSHGRWTRFDASDGLTGSLVYDTHLDAVGTLWVSTNGGVGRLASGRFQPLPQPADTPLSRVDTIAADLDHGIWFCDRGSGLYRWKQGAWRSFKEQLPAECSHVESDSKGRIWVALLGGVLALIEHEQPRIFTAADGVGGPINVIHEDASGDVWLGTRRGISRFADGRFVNIRLDELPETNVTAITDEGNGHLWLGVGSVLVRIDGSELTQKSADPSYRMQYRTFDKTDGLPGVPLSLCCSNSARASDGRLWFLTTGGVAVVDPRRLQQERPAPPILIENITVDGQPVTPRTDLRLPPLTSTIQIDYTTLALAAASKARFRYRLEGFDREWVDAGTRRQASYTNLPPGHYRFRVGSRTGNDWSSADAGWAFSIAPTFYQTRSFIVASLVGFFACIGAAWHLRVRQMRRQFSLVVAERARMAGELHDTLLQGLVGVALQFDGIAQQMTVAPATAQDRLRRVRRQVEQFIRDTRTAIYDLRSDQLQRDDLHTALRETGEMLTEGRDVRFSLQVEGTPRRLSGIIEEQILRVGGEAISNAVRHASATDVRASLAYSDNAVRLQVADNGGGFDVERALNSDRPGLGLSTMRERAQRSRGNFSLASAPGSGTRVEFVVPSPYAHGH